MGRRLRRCRRKAEAEAEAANGIAELMKQPSDDEDAKPSDEKLPRLTALLEEQIAESAELDERIARILKELGRGL